MGSMKKELRDMIKPAVAFALPTILLPAITFITVLVFGVDRNDSAALVMVALLLGAVGGGIAALAATV